METWGWNGTKSAFADYAAGAARSAGDRVGRGQGRHAGRWVHGIVGIGIALVIAAVPAVAQNDTTPAGVRLRMTYESQVAPGLVVLPFAGDEGGAARQIISRDLEFSDRFEMKDAPGGTPAERPDIAAWRERGADWVLQGAIDGSTLRLTLHDAVYGQVKGTGTFALPGRGERGFRMAVHAASDQVVRWATGQPGFAASRIAFVTAGRGSKEIYVVDADGEGTARLTSDGSIALSPAWAPDGRRLAYTSFKRGGPYLFERDLSSGGERTVSGRDGINITPAYSPDGRTIAFGATVGGNTELALSAGGGFQTLTQSRRYENLSPSFSPDGGRIAFVSDRLGEPAVYVMDASGGEPRLVSGYTYGRRGYSTSPDWSPTGPWIAYSTRVAGVAQIAVVGSDGRGARLLTDRGRNEDPSWAPDGRHLVFASPDRDGSGGLFVLDTVTGKVRTLVAGRGFGLPAWSPVLARATGGE